MDESEDQFEIILGTYDSYILGYQNQSLDQSFAYRGHTGHVKCLAVSDDGQLALSVGQDEILNLFDLRKRRIAHTFEGSVNCACFVGSTHLICGSEDGDIHIHECKGMKLIKKLKGHKAAVLSISMHPSQKVLVSLSKDNVMITWNLVKGRSAYVKSYGTLSPHLVSWSRAGNNIMLAVNNQIIVYNIDGRIELEIKVDRRINCIEFLSENIFIIGFDSTKIEFYDLAKKTSLGQFQAHESRVKSIKLVCSDESNCHMFVSASSDGAVKLWSLADLNNPNPELVSSIDIGSRITCMTAASVASV